MEAELLKIAGPLGLSIAIIWFIVRAFLGSIKEQRTDFMKIISNHMEHDLELHQKTIEALDKITDSQKDNTLVMRELLNFLKK